MSANLEAIPKDTKVPPGGKVHLIEDWDVYFLAIAEIVACKSEDTNCQVGAVLVTPDSVVISTGYNGFARGVFDNENLLKDTDEKLKWICHAEVNAIWNAGRLGVPLKGCSIYVNKFPCFSCCNAIVQSGISRIYTHDHSYWKNDPFDPDHSRKRSLLKQSALKVAAPFHPDFRPRAPLKRERIVTAFDRESSI
jgi:dCMP deaminase